MYQDLVTSVSDNSFSDLLDGTETNNQMNLDIMDFDSILQHPTRTYSLFNQSILEIDPVPTQQTEINTYLPISCDPINNQPKSFPKSNEYCTQQWSDKDNRFQEKQGTVNTTHIADSNKHLGKIVKSHYKINKPILITPPTNSYLKGNPTPSEDPSFNKSSQTDLSFSNKPHTIESSTYSAIHTALSLLKSMDQPERETKNNAGYILRTQKNRQKVLHDLNIEMTKINNTEAQRYYTINCARNCTFKKNPIDSN